MFNKKFIGAALATALAFAPIASFAGESQSFPPIQQHVVIFVAEGTIFGFDFDEDDVKDEQVAAFQAKVIEFGQQMAANSNWRLRIEGHADETGTEEYNIGLSTRRIDDLAALLLQGGAQDSQIQRVPYGEINPLADGHSDLAWATNRRIVARLFIVE